MNTKSLHKPPSRFLRNSALAWTAASAGLVMLGGQRFYSKRFRQYFRLSSLRLRARRKNGGSC